MSIQSTMERIGSCDVHMLAAGSGGRAVILLHGMKFRAATWEELGTLEAIAAQGHHAIAVDMPGFGDSPPCSMGHTELLAALVEQLEIKAPVLVGPSMGGRIALEFALAHPGIPGGLVLAGPVGVAENQEGLAAIRCPVLAAWGSEDAISPPEHGRILSESIQDCQVETFPGSPHPCYLDQPERWHALLTGFLSRLGA